MAARADYLSAADTPLHIGGSQADGPPALRYFNLLRG
jgi:hypothetical protein